MKYISIAIVWLLLSSICEAQSPSAIAGNPRLTASLANITANVAGSGLTIPANFVGLSGEVSDFNSGFYQGTSGTWTSAGSSGNAASYISLINLLGSGGVFRIGGGSAESFGGNSVPAITAPVATSLASFLAALGASWTLIYNLDLFGNDTAKAVTSATNLSAAVSATMTFQFGNEPSSFLTAAAYQTRWNAYYTAVIGAVPGATFGAIDDGFNLTWGDPVTVAQGLTPGLAGLAFFSEHWYSFCNGSWPNPVPAYMLQSIFGNANSGPILAAPNRGAGFLYPQGKVGSLPLRMSESNTICLHGQTGMSDRLMASTWFLDMAILLATNGWAGINVHSVWGQGGIPGIGNYNVVIAQPDLNFSPGTIFYGMYLFSKIQGKQIVPSAIGGSGNISAIAVKGGGGNAMIIAANNDINGSVSLSVDQSGAWTTATVLQIKGGGCSEATPTVGGQSIGESGSWSGAPFSINKGQSISLGPCGAALIQIQP